MELHIIRHGQSEGNVTRRDLPDAELTELGRSQAAVVGERLRDTGFDAIIASPLARAIDTAMPLARHRGLPVLIWKDTYEVRSRGPYTGPALSELRRRFPEARFGDDMEPDGWIYPGDETPMTGQQRAQRVYDRLRDRFDGKRVALFAHGGFNRRLLIAALGLPYDSGIYFYQSNGCMYKLTENTDTTALHHIGDIPAGAII